VLAGLLAQLGALRAKVSWFDLNFKTAWNKADSRDGENDSRIVKGLLTALFS